VVSPGEDREVEALISELALAALSDQRQAVDDLRTRAGILLAAGSLGATLVGPRALGGSESLVVAWVATTSVAVYLLSCLWVLWPRNDMSFNAGGPRLSQRLRRYDDLLAAHRIVSYLAAGLHDSNELVLQQLYLVYRVAIGALGFQVTFWVAWTRA